MDTEVRVDDQVVIEVLTQVGVQWGDPDFEKLVDYVRLRYLHYQHLAEVNEFTQAAFDRSIKFALISDIGELFIGKFDLTAEQAALGVAQMQAHYHFTLTLSLEEQTTVDKLIQALPKGDQAVMQLLRDGLTQREIASATGISRATVSASAEQLKEMYEYVKRE